MRLQYQRRSTWMDGIADDLTDAGDTYWAADDELDFSVPAGEVERLAAMVKEVMEGVVELKVPLIADVSWGPTWAEAH